MNNKEKKARYATAALLALLLSLLCAAVSFWSAPPLLIREWPAGALPYEGELSFEYVNCAPDDTGTIRVHGADPQIYIYGLEGPVCTLCVVLEEPLASGTTCQLYYVPRGETISEDKSEAFTSTLGQKELFFTIRQEDCEYYRLDIDADARLAQEAFLIAPQEAERQAVDRWQLLREGDFSYINLRQWLFCFVLLLVQALWLAGKEEVICTSLAALRRSLRENRRSAAAAAASFGCFLLAGLLVYAAGTGLGLLPANGASRLFVLTFFAGLGAIVSLRRLAGRRPEIVFFLVCLCAGTMLATVTPVRTTVSLDDESHYRQAMRLSYGGLTWYTEADNLILGQKLSGGATWDEQEMLRETLDLAWENGAYAVASGDLLSIHTISYLPSASGLWLARAMGLSFSSCFLTGRLANLFAYALIMALAIRKFRPAAPLLSVFALLPTLLFLASNYSYDGYCIAYLALGTACFCDEYSHPERRLTLRAAVCMYAAFVLGCLSKAIYFPIFLMPLFMPREKFAGRKDHVCYIASAFACVFFLGLSFTLPFVVSRGGNYTDVRGGSGVSGGSQGMFILSHPLTYTKLLLRFIFGTYLRLSNIVSMSIGYLAYMPAATTAWPMAALLLAGFLLSAGREAGTAKSPGALLRLGGIVFFFCAICLAATSMYVAFTPVGAMTINGCQQRYMMPVLLPLLVLLRPTGLSLPCPAWLRQCTVLGLGLILLYAGTTGLIPC